MIKKKSRMRSTASGKQSGEVKVKKAVNATKTTKRIKKKDIWELRLYVAGQTPKSMTAFANLKKICEEHLPGRFTIEVVDLLENPQLAAGDQILAIPTLVRKLPQPIRKIIGDLSNTEKTLVGLNIRDWMQKNKPV